MDTLTNLTALIAEHAVIPAESLCQDDTLRTLGLDSLDCVELVTDIEEAFEVEFTDPLPGPDITIAQLVTLIQTANA